MNLITILLAIAAVSPVQCQITRTGGLKIDGLELNLKCKAAGKNYTIVSTFDESEGLCRNFDVERSKGKTVMSGVSSWEQKPDGTLSGEMSLKMLEAIETQELTLMINFPYETFSSASWTANGKKVSLGEKGFFRKVTAQSLTLNLPDGKDITIGFEKPVQFSTADFRKTSKAWRLRFGFFPGPMSFLRGDKVTMRFCLSSSYGMNIVPYRNYVISEGPEWIWLKHSKDFVEGSALDFSGMKLQDGPSGKYGWLKAEGGNLCFEKKPGVPQRFCGANLCLTANFLPHELADTLIDRFVRMGYNAIRIHHQDKDLRVSDNWDRLDYLIAKGIEKGIYFTTDLYVSRVVRYEDLGLPEKGEIPKGLYKVLVVCYEPAFKDWCKYAKEFLEHVNPYTGRAYKDEPAIPLISLINEGKLTNVGNKNYPPIYDEWIRWGGQGRLAYNSEGIGEFEEYLTRKAFVKCSAFVRSLGGKALLSNDNSGKNHGEGKGTTPLYDYVDNHFYTDHHKFIGAKRYALPSTQRNINFITEGGTGMFKDEYIRTASKPYTLTEWNFCGPNRFRSMSGLMAGSQSSLHGWDGIWRFAYSHSLKDVAWNPDSFPSTFNLATDPLNLASERATVCLFLRNDMTDDHGFSMDVSAGTLRAVSKRTCGFFREAGVDTAGPFSATISGAPASIWVSSLDDNPIEDSRRMLLVHLTDVQGDGIRFADESRTIILKWGVGTLVQRGSADVSLSLSDPGSYSVYELGTDGARTGKLPSDVCDGRLEFRVSTDGPNGGRIYYEIVRE